VSLYTTRFVERHTTVQCFWESFPAVVFTLQQIENRYDSQASSSFSLRTCLEKSDTIVGLVCLKSISSIMTTIFLCSPDQRWRFNVSTSPHRINENPFNSNEKRRSGWRRKIFLYKIIWRVFWNGRQYRNKTAKASFGFQINLHVRFKH